MRPTGSGWSFTFVPTPKSGAFLPTFVASDPALTFLKVDPFWKVSRLKQSTVTNSPFAKFLD